MLLQNKNAVIYVGGGAIGGAVARAFAREGAKVFLAGRTLAKLDQVAREISAAGNNKTEMTITEYGHTSDQMFDLSKAGLEQCLDKMAEALAQRY